MAKLAGGFLRIWQTLLYLLCFLCAAVILGIYSYFLAVKADRHAGISNVEKAITGMSGAAVLYTIPAVLMTVCLGGVKFFAFLGIVLDVLFCGAFIAIAVLTRQATQSCSASTVYTPIGSGDPSSRDGFQGGNSNNVTFSVKLGTACRLNQAVFAVSIIGAFFFLFAAVSQVWVARHHQREKRYGPSPSNNYTSGSSKRKFWQRKSGPKTTHQAYHKDAELGTAGLAAQHEHDMRPSHDTAYTGTTVHSPAHNGTFAGNKYETTTHSPLSNTTHAAPVTGNHGYHTGPTGTGVNPYGYDNTKSAGTNF